MPNTRCNCPGLISVCAFTRTPSYNSVRPSPNHVCDTFQLRTTHGASANMNTAAQSPTRAAHRFLRNDTPTYTSSGTSTATNAYCVNVPTATANVLTTSALFTHTADLPASCHFSALNSANVVSMNSSVRNPNGNPATAESNNGSQTKYRNALVTATRC